MTELKKKINLFGLTMIAVGSCIGSGIFVTPYEVVQAVPHHGFVLIIWALGGVIALTGALTFAELGGMFPKAGGVYVFLREAYGETFGFLYGWVILMVINTGALAALGMALAEYITFFIPLSAGTKVLFAIIVVLGLTIINGIGVHLSQALANIFTGLKLLAMLAIVVVGFMFFEPENVSLNLNLFEGTPPSLISGLLIGLIGVLWSIGGWHHASYLAGETINASKNVPRAMVLGALIVTLMYVLINLAYMLLLPLSDIANSARVAGDAVGSVIPSGGKMVAVAIAISIFGTISIYTMSAPRIYFAMAEDRLFFKQLAKVHPRFRTPLNAMMIQAFWAVALLVFWRTFSDLIAYVTFMDIAFMALAGASVFILREKRPDLTRPYKVWGYPIIPAIFISISSAFVINTLIQRPRQAIAGLIFTGIGLLIFFVFKKRKDKYVD